MRPAAVLFDADGVLQHEGRFAEHMAEHHGWDGARYQAFFSELWAAETACLDGTADLLTTLPTILDRHGWGEGPEAFLQTWFEIGIVPDRDAFEVVARTRAQGVVCALATNQQAYRAAHMLDVLGYRERFDHVFVSCELGAAKPSPSYFEAALHRLGRPAGSVLFIDDHAANVDSARQVGLLAAHYTSDDDLAAVLAAHGISC